MGSWDGQGNRAKQHCLKVRDQLLFEQVETIAPSSWLQEILAKGQDLAFISEKARNVIVALRQLAVRGTSVRELTSEIHHRLGLNNEAVIPVLWYFTEVFGLTLREVLPIREWIGTDRDEDIDALIMPAIVKAMKQ